MYCLRRDDDSTAIEDVTRHVCAHHAAIESRSSLVSGPEDKAHVSLERRPTCVCHGVQLQNCQCTHGALQAMGFAEQQGLAVEKIRFARRNVLEMPKQPRLAAKNHCEAHPNRKLSGKRKVRLGRGPGGRSATWGFNTSIFLPRHWACDLAVI